MGRGREGREKLALRGAAKIPPLRGAGAVGKGATGSRALRSPQNPDGDGDEARRHPPSTRILGGGSFWGAKGGFCHFAFPGFMQTHVRSQVCKGRKHDRGASVQGEPARKGSKLEKEACKGNKHAQGTSVQGEQACEGTKCARGARTEREQAWKRSKLEKGVSVQGQ